MVGSAVAGGRAGGAAGDPDLIERIRNLAIPPAWAALSLTDPARSYRAT